VKPLRKIIELPQPDHHLMNPSPHSHKQPAGHTPDSRGRRITWLIGGLTVAFAVTLVLTRHGNNPENMKHSGPDSTVAPEKASGQNRQDGSINTAPSTPENATADAAASPQPDASAQEPATTAGPEKTRATRRDEIVTASGKRKTQLDPMASWSDLPPWPEGPRLFAEVETSSRRYINLRPDDIGELPRVMADAEERIELRVNFPEGEPGEKIHVEIPNGGAFADSKVRGRIYQLPENRTLSFPFITDDSHGHCNVKFRHRGHTRSLPVWVGDLPETASADPES
jgi:hypothetical protein